MLAKIVSSIVVQYFADQDMDCIKHLKCFDCDKLIDGLYYTDNLNRTFCEADYKVKSQQML